MRATWIAVPLLSIVVLGTVHAQEQASPRRRRTPLTIDAIRKVSNPRSALYLAIKFAKSDPVLRKALQAGREITLVEHRFSDSERTRLAISGYDLNLPAKVGREGALRIKQNSSGQVVIANAATDVWVEWKQVSQNPRLGVPKLRDEKHESTVWLPSFAWLAKAVRTGNTAFRTKAAAWHVTATEQLKDVTDFYRIKDANTVANALERARAQLAAELAPASSR